MGDLRFAVLIREMMLAFDGFERHIRNQRRSELQLAGVDTREEPNDDDDATMSRRVDAAAQELSELRAMMRQVEALAEARRPLAAARESVKDGGAAE